MWLIVLLWFVIFANFALDLLERKQKGQTISWHEVRGGFFASIAFGIVIGGGYGFLLMFPAIGKKPFPSWLGLSLALGLLLFLWFGATFAVIGNKRSELLSPLQVVNEGIGEEQIGFLGVLAIIVAGVALVRFDFPLWFGFILLLPIWVILFYLWASSNWILAWMLLGLRNSKRKNL